MSAEQEICGGKDLFFCFQMWKCPEIPDWNITKPGLLLDLETRY